MQNIFKRYREPIAVSALLLVSLAIWLVYSKRGRDPTIVDRAIAAAAAPVEGAISSSLGFLLDRWERYVALRGVEAENLALRQERAQLSAEVMRLMEERAENQRLRELLSFSRARETETLTASVIGEGPALNILSLRLNRGTSDGVSKGMAVVSPEGIVGRVIEAGGASASAILLWDSNFAVPVRVQRSRARAKVVGQGGGRMPMLIQALRTDDIVEGDLLVTAGTDGVFPKGLVVGKVSGLSRPGTGMFQSANVLPAVAVERLEEVLLLPIPGADEMRAASLDRTAP